MENESVVELAGLTKRFGDFVAVSNVDLAVAAGDIFALLGPNGAGKTTTIRMLMGILQPSAGSASVLGLDCFRDRAAVMRRVGYLPDEPIFYDYLRGDEILRFVGEMHGIPGDEIQDRAAPLVKQLDLAGALKEYAVNYSKGMKKKLAIVCALLHDPVLLVLDEPTNGLDPYATRTFHDLIRAKAEAGNSVCFSTHLLDQAERLCHHVGIVHKGKLAAIGKLDDLRSSLAEGGSLEEIFFAVTDVEAEAE